MRYCLHGGDGCLRVYCVTVPCQAALEDFGTEFLVAGFGLALVAVLQARSLRSGAAAITAAIALIPTASWLAWAVRWRTAGPPQLCFRIYPTLPIPRLRAEPVGRALRHLRLSTLGARRCVLRRAHGRRFPGPAAGAAELGGPARAERCLSCPWQRRVARHAAVLELPLAQRECAAGRAAWSLHLARMDEGGARSAAPACARESGPSQHRRRRARPPGARHLEVGGCARSIGKRGVDALEGKVTALAELGAFASVVAHVFEDGSSDETLPALRAWAARMMKSAVPLKITTALEPLGGERTDRLAICRNVLFASAQDQPCRARPQTQCEAARGPPCDPPT